MFKGLKGTVWCVKALGLDVNGLWGGARPFRLTCWQMGFEVGREVNLEGKGPPASRCRIRVNRCCMSIMAKPAPDTAGEKIKKGNVNERRFKLSYDSPTTRVRVGALVANVLNRVGSKIKGD